MSKNNRKPAAAPAPKHQAGAMAKPFFRASLQGNGTLEMLVYEEIGEDWWTGGGVTAKSIKEQMDAAGPYNKILLRINSPGGDAFEGLAIHNLVRAQGKPVEVCVDGLAASSASIIAMCGDTITMGHNAMMMIHNAWSLCVGEAADMRKMAETLEKISESIGQTYVDRTGKTADEIKTLMDAETWMTAEECVQEGFATAIASNENEEGALAMARQFKSLTKMRRVPDALKPAAAAPVANEDPAPPEPDPQVPTCACDCEACVAGTCASCTHDACACENCEDCPMKPAENAAPEDSNLSLYEARLSLLTHRV